MFEDEDFLKSVTNESFFYNTNTIIIFKIDIEKCMLNIP